ncbi:hypothetical protein K1T71_011505 [Dendrolimus kikuchii]|uniref:Uncharacterized protein n=1 Tax=Dendrolimus kikuchii TaxID=765133 RepID=A0ACC1CNY9_9NEOP|nr:hypothetical protein K1T71_011505 [Dendrolimus kikuchii]
MAESESKICSNCKREIPAVNYTIHTVHCARNIKVCPVCKEPVPQVELQEHHEKYHKLLPCKQCGESVCGTDLEDHIRDSCANTIKSCRFCELELPRRDLPYHEGYCGVRTEQCPDCREWVMIKYRQLHVDSNHGFLRLDDDPIPKKEPPKNQIKPLTVKNTNLPSTSNFSRDIVTRVNLNRPTSEIRHLNQIANLNNINTTATSSALANGEPSLVRPPLKRTNDQPQINTNVTGVNKVNKDIAIARGAVKKRPAPKPPVTQPPVVDAKRETAYHSALLRQQRERRQRQEQNAINLAAGLPPVLSPAEKIEKLRKMDALHNREFDNEDYKNRLQGRVWNTPQEPSGHVLGISQNASNSRSLFNSPTNSSQNEADNVANLNARIRSDGMQKNINLISDNRRPLRNINLQSGLQNANNAQNGNSLFNSNNSQNNHLPNLNTSRYQSTQISESSLSANSPRKAIESNNSQNEARSQISDSAQNGVRPQISNSPQNGVRAQICDRPQNGVRPRISNSPQNEARAQICDSPQNGVSAQICDSPQNGVRPQISNSPLNGVRAQSSNGAPIDSLGTSPSSEEDIERRREEFKNLKPMTTQEFMERFNDLQLGRGRRREEGDRFSEIKSSLRELRRGLNEVTAPYNLQNNITPNASSPPPDDEVILPCEFCGAPVPAEDLVQHQTGCRPDLAQYRPVSPMRRSPIDSAVLNTASAILHEHPLIPCEFCTESLPVYLITEHQERCGRETNMLYAD